MDAYEVDNEFKAVIETNGKVGDSAEETGQQLDAAQDDEAGVGVGAEEASEQFDVAHEGGMEASTNSDNRPDNGKNINPLLLFGSLFLTLFAAWGVFLGIKQDFLIPSSAITKMSSLAYATDLPVSSYWIFETLDDSPNRPHSRTKLFEDSKLLGPEHSTHDDVYKAGLGHFSHWDSRLYFSTSDNSDPRVNGHRYKVVYTATLPMWMLAASVLCLLISAYLNRQAVSRYLLLPSGSARQKTLPLTTQSVFIASPLIKQFIYLALVDRYFRRVVFIIAVFGFALRISTILWGTGVLPHTGLYHPDEPTTYHHAIEFPGNYGNDTDFMHGTAVPYALAAVLLPVKALVTLPHWQLICLFGMRLLSVLAGTASIIIVHRLARHFYNEYAALLAAGFTAVSLTHCLNSTFATQDIIVSFFILACFLTLFRAIESGRMKDFLIFGALVGILLSTKTSTVVFLGVMPMLAVIDIARALWRGEARLTARRWLGWLIICNTTAFVVFAITSPSVLLDFSGFLQFYRDKRAAWYDPSMVPWSQVPRIWWDVSSAATGMPTVAAFLVGIMLRSRERSEKLATLGFMLLYCLLLRHYVLPRFVANLSPLICLFAACCCASLLTRRLALLRVAGIGVAAAILTISVWGCAVGIYTRFADPRTQAAYWLKDYVQPGGTIGIADIYFNVTTWQDPPIDDLGLRRVPMQAHPEVIVMSGYTSAVMDQALRSPKLKDWVWDPKYAADWYNRQIPSPETFKFFDKLIHETGEYRREIAFRPPSNRFQFEFCDVSVLIYRRLPPEASRR